MKKAIIFTTWIFLYSCTNNTIPNIKSDNTTTNLEAGASDSKRVISKKKSRDDDQAKKMIWIEKGKDAVKMRLKDPDSAAFKKVYFSRGKRGIPMVCGQVNAKNGFGGFSGFEYFISGTTENLTFLESEVKDFSKAWKELCIE